MAHRRHEILGLLHAFWAFEPLEFGGSRAGYTVLRLNKLERPLPVWDTGGTSTSVALVDPFRGRTLDGRECNASDAGSYLNSFR